MADPQYKRLTRSRTRSAFAIAVTSRSSLWLGPDHLLVIDTNGYTENYKRFYFRDIQAFAITLNRRRLVWNWVLSVLAAGCLSSSAYYLISVPSWGIEAVAITSAITLLFALPLLINNLLGSTCTCHLRTAVQTEHLCPLSRLRRARRVIDRLRPLILQVQGVAAGGESSTPAQPHANAPVARWDADPAGAPPPMAT